MKKFSILMTILFLLSSGISNAEAKTDFYLKNNLNVLPNMNLSDPLNIKLDLYVIRKTDGTGGWTHAKIFEFVDLTKSVFGVHGIYLNICINEIKNDYYFNNNNFSSNIAQNGIDLNEVKAIIGVLNPGGGGDAPAPGKLFNASSPNIAIHELGHCLGLFHTFEMGHGCNEMAPVIEGNQIIWGANADITGDLVKDTPADLHPRSPYSLCPSQFKTIYVGHPLCKMENPDSIVDELGNLYQDILDPYGSGKYYIGSNIMSYNPDHRCRRLITPGQAERIRNEVLKISEVIIEEGLYQEAPVFNMDFDIYENTTWSEYDIILNGNIYVNNGHFIIENSNIKFTEGHKLIVRPSFSGYTVVDIVSTTLDVSAMNHCSATSGSDPTWGGIVLDLGVGGYSEFPWLYIVANSTIKNAEKAISNISYNQGNIFWLHIYDSNFEDNIMALDIINATASIWVRNSEFTYKRSSADGHISHIRFINSNGSMFRDSRIINMISNYNGLTSGFDIFNSNIGFFGNLSEVKNWNTGINRGSGIGKIFTLKNTSIFDCYRQGIYAYGNYTATGISNNKFLNNFRKLELPSHITMLDQGNTSITISKNEFGPLGLSNVVGGFGLRVVSKFEDDYNLIYNNYFHSNLTTGVSWVNSNLSDVSHTKFLCNKMENNGNSQIYTIGNIHKFQASTDEDSYLASAGNTYTHVPGFNFYANASYRIQYHYMEDNENPYNSEGIDKILNSNSADCPQNYFNIEEEDDHVLGDGGTGKELDIYTETKTKYDGVIEIFDNSVDNGNTHTVIGVINSVNQLNAQSVTDYLVALGPWMSDQAAVALIDNSQYFTAHQMMSIVVANPDNLFNTTAYQFALGPNSVFNTVQQDIIRSMTNVVTPRTRLLANIDHLSHKMNYVINKALQKVIFNDSGFINFADYRAWLERKNTNEKVFEIANTFFSEGKYHDAVSYLQTIKGKGNYTLNQIEDIDKFISIITLLNDLYNSQRNEFQLNGAELSYLEAIALSDCPMSKSKARGILEFFYGYVFEDESALNPRSYNFNGLRQELHAVPEMVEVYPNPSGGIFHICISSQDKIVGIRKIEVYDLQGRVVYAKQYENAQPVIMIDLMHQSNGLFHYLIIDENQKIHNGKLIKE